jgi:MFS superfamily sulfate permease-like transporter
VAHFPHTVLTGAIGGIGVALFILGLELMLPESSPPLTLPTAGSVLFNSTHLPLLAVSFFPALLLSVSKRSQRLERWTFGASTNVYFIPVCLCAIPFIFWVIVAPMNIPNETLVRNGWLFRVDLSASEQSGIGTGWIYWREFDFPKVEWWAIKSATTNMALLVVIGVLNLPIFVPALAYKLNVPYDMDHEFLGQGVANLLAGLAGTVPNILVSLWSMLPPQQSLIFLIQQYSYSVFITEANGGRFEMGLVTLLTLVLFFTSSLLLPYVPTALASSLVLFLGMELGLEALWEAAITLPRLDWGICMATLIACTFIGFAEGFIVGILVAAFIHCVYGSAESVSHIFYSSVRVILMFFPIKASNCSSNFNLKHHQMTTHAHASVVMASRRPRRQVFLRACISAYISATSMSSCHPLFSLRHIAEYNRHKDR